MSLDQFNANKYFDVFGKGQTPNPFYSIANQFVPRNFHDIIKWSRYILTQSPTTVEVLRKLSTYPITDFDIDSASPSVRDKYEAVLKSVRMKNILNDVGFDYYTLGNVYLSIYFPIRRMLRCPACGTEHDARNIGSGIKFEKYTFTGECSNCSFHGHFERIDRKSTNVEDINIIKWAAEHISLNHNPITGETEYYYKIPNSTKRKVMLGDPSFVATVPWTMIEAVKNNQDYKFDRGNIFHLRSISMGDVLEGMGMPPVISLYSSIFHQTLLKRANEAIATEHMTPFRVIFPQQNSGAGDPIAMMSLGNFVQNMEDQLKKFKGDPNHITIAPVPVGYQSVGGQGRALLVSQELQFIEETLLMGMGVSRELLSGTTNWTSSTVGLRMLENTMHDYTSQVQEFIDWSMSKISSFLGLANVKIELTPFELTDDQILKQALPGFMNSGSVSESTTLKAFGIDFNEELQKRKEDAIAKAVAQVEEEHEVKMAVFMKTKDVESENQDDNGFRETQEKAYETARNIIAMDDPHKQTEALWNLHSSDRLMYSQVAEILARYSEIQESTREEARSDMSMADEVQESVVRESERMARTQEAQQRAAQKESSEESKAQQNPEPVKLKSTGTDK